jgi:hypothetical protein
VKVLGRSEKRVEILGRSRKKLDDVEEGRYNINLIKTSEKLNFYSHKGLKYY